MRSSSNAMQSPEPELPKPRVCGAPRDKFFRWFFVAVGFILLALLVVFLVLVLCTNIIISHKSSSSSVSSISPLGGAVPPSSSTGNCSKASGTCQPKPKKKPAPSGLTVLRGWPKAPPLVAGAPGTQRPAPVVHRKTPRPPSQAGAPPPAPAAASSHSPRTKPSPSSPAVAPSPGGAAPPAPWPTGGRSNWRPKGNPADGPGPSMVPLQQEYNWTELGMQGWGDRYYMCSGMNEQPNLGWRINVYAQGTNVTWRGWGTTLAWWARAVASFDNRTYDEIMRLTFHEDGMGINAVRYQIPGSYNPDYSPKIASSNAQSQGFKLAPDAPYNWSQDAQQVRVLKDSRLYGANVFEAISYSAPWWMTISGDIAGSPSGGPNFRSEYAADFAAYLADVVDHFAVDSSIGVLFDAVAPFNEALEGWWFSGRNKEGCDFTSEDMSNVTLALSDALTARNLPTGIAVLDSWTTYTIHSFNGGGLSAQAVQAVSRIDVHGYITPNPGGVDYDTEQYTTLQALGAQYNKDIWQTEWGPLGYHGSDMQLAALMGRVICQHINQLGVSAWFLWQAVSWRNPGGWGALQLRYRKRQLQISRMKQFHVFRHFSQWIRPGSIPVVVATACQPGVVAAYDPARTLLSVTVVNQRYFDFFLQLNVSSFVGTSPGGVADVAVYRTSMSEDYRLVDYYRFQTPAEIQLVSSGLTVTTVVMFDVTSISLMPSTS